MSAEVSFKLAYKSHSTSSFDAVFIHGITGDPEGTWTNASGEFWPCWIARDIPGVSVYTAGYPSSYFGKWNKKEMDLFEQSASILEFMVSLGLGERPIALICHSLGGLLGKELVRIAHESQDKDWSKLGRQIKLIAFLATPHRGANLAHVLKFAFPHLSSSFIASMSGETGHIANLYNSYRDIAARNNIATIAYYEKHNTPGLGLIVTPDSADPGYLETRPLPVDSDHIQICKPQTDQAFVYTSLRRHLASAFSKHASGKQCNPHPTAFQNALIRNFALKGELPTLSDQIESHFESITRWSELIKILGMDNSKETRTITIPLAMNSTPRRFLRSSAASQLTENELLDDKFNYIILGDPGSGKTTQIRRLIQELSRRIRDSNENDGPDSLRIPFLVVAREMKRGQEIYRALADQIGIAYEFRHHKRQRAIESEEDIAFSAFISNDRDTFSMEHSGDYYYDGMRLENFIHSWLNKSNAILLVDGLDELHAGVLPEIEAELERLARNARIKVVVTCRSGESHISKIEGFRSVEIAPLRKEDIEQIANRWATNPLDFLNQLAIAPYSDTADRPLFLVQLIQIFNSRLRLPPSARDVYPQIILLCLEIWDSDRRIVRLTQYAGFTSERKLEFLAALSYSLTYEIKCKRFTHLQLLEAYGLVHNRFRLPREEAVSVCQEIESHTGILFESGGVFEFSHLSLQEYLCAHHMVRLAPVPTFVKYLVTYPAPVAVAIGLSSDPSDWFANLIFYTKNFSDKNPQFRDGLLIKENTIVSLLARINVEAPIFTENLPLGLALIRLFGLISSIDEQSTLKQSHTREQEMSLATVRQFLAMEGVLASIAQAFRRYYFDTIDNLGSTSNSFTMIGMAGLLEEFHGRLPREVTVNRSVVRFFQLEYRMDFTWVSAEDEMILGPLPF